MCLYIRHIYKTQNVIIVYDNFGYFTEPLAH